MLMSESRVMERAISGERAAAVFCGRGAVVPGEMDRAPIFEVFIFYYLKDMPD